MGFFIDYLGLLFFYLHKKPSENCINTSVQIYIAFMHFLLFIAMLSMTSVTIVNRSGFNISPLNVRLAIDFS